MSLPTCKHCGQEIEYYGGNVNAWVETRSGDDGGYYDICPENPSGEPDAGHEPVRTWDVCKTCGEEIGESEDGTILLHVNETYDHIARKA